MFPFACIIFFNSFKISGFLLPEVLWVTKALQKIQSHPHLLKNPSCTSCCRQTGICSCFTLPSSAFFSLPYFYTFADKNVFPISSSLQAYAGLHIHSKHAFSLGPLHLLFALPGTFSCQISACLSSCLCSPQLIIKQCTHTVTFICICFSSQYLSHVTLLLLFHSLCHSLPQKGKSRAGFILFRN